MSSQSAIDLNAYGEARYREGDLEGARDAFSQALRADPGYVPACNNLAVLLWESGKRDDAAAMLEHAHRLDSGHRDCVLNLGSVLSEQGEPERALEIFERYLREHADAEIARAVDQLRASSGHLPERPRVLYAHPSLGNTERFITLEAVGTSGPPLSFWRALKDYSVEGTGVGIEAVAAMIAHVFATKLERQPRWDEWRWEDTLVVPFACQIGPRPGASNFSEEPARLRSIEEYASRLRSGEDLGKPLYITGTLLDRLGGGTPPGEIYMLDGARRLAASAFAQRETIDTWILMHESEFPRCFAEPGIAALQRELAALEWFQNYQSMPIVGIRGERTLKRFGLMDLALLRDRSVMDFGCNIGQACMKAILAGASTVVGVEGMRDTFALAERICEQVAFQNLRYLNADFNSPDFDLDIERSVPGQVDYSFFFSVYRTKELIQRDRLFRYIIDKSRLGVFFEGHAHPKIDTLEYYDWLFDSFGLRYEFLGHSEGELRPLFFLPTEGRPGRKHVEGRASGAGAIRHPESTPIPCGRAPLSTDEYLLAGQHARSDTPGEFVVSAVISAYASERFMDGRLRDLLAQTLGDRLEIIVIDSGSPENEREIVETYAARHSNIVYLRTDERETVYQAWNRGIRMARGRFITNANTDDRLRPDALEMLAGVLELQPECAVVYGDFHITGCENQTFGEHVRTGYSVKPDFDAAIMLSGCHMGPQPMWRRSLHEELGYFDEDLKAAGDYEFWCRVATCHEMLHLPEFLGVYLHNPRGICNSQSALVDRECSAVQELYRERLPPFSGGPVPTGYYWRDALRDGSYVNVCMVSYNRLDFTRQAIDSLMRWTRFPHVISVVDNASNDGTREYLLEQRRRGVIKNLILLDENVGVAKASNIAWEMEPEAAYYLKYDNDVLIEKEDWLADMIRVVEAIPRIGVLGYNFESESVELSEVDGVPLRVKRSGNIGGACILIPRRTRELLGCWCEDYGLYGEEDADYATRVTQMGLWNAYMADEETPFHLPAGKAAKIDSQTMVAEDGKEEVRDRDYRLWKDEQRRRNTQPESTYICNQSAYKSGLRPLLNQPRAGWKALSILGISFRDEIRSDPVLANRILTINEALDALHFREALRLASENLRACDARERLLEKLHVIAKSEPLIPPKVSLIVPVDSEAIRDCLAWLKESTLYSSWELIVVESGVPAACLPETLHFARIVHNEQSKGWMAACNQGSGIASGEYLAFLNAGTVPQRGWLTELIRSLLAHPDVGIVGSHVIRGTRKLTGESLSPEAFLISAAHFRAVGGLDSSLEPRPALADLRERLRLRNLEARHVPGSLVLLHEKPQSVETEPGRVLDRARASLEAGDVAKAFATVVVAKETRRPLPGLDQLRAECFLGMGRPDDAREALKEELRQFPGNAEAQRQLEDLLALAAGTNSLQRWEPEFEELLQVVRPYTMVPPARLYSLYRLARQVCTDDVPGDFVECGVAGGGSSALIAAVVKRYSTRPRSLHAFDSFEGMPAPTQYDTQGGVAADSTGWGAGTCASPVDSLREICRSLGVLDVVRAVPGDFEKTLPRESERIGEIAFLHLDGDWYASTRAILENLYDQVVPGGILQFDDYGCWDGCRRAVHEFEARSGVVFGLERIDTHGVWMRKGESG